MNVILLSGGSGKRLWPLSNASRSKQFLKVLRRDDGAPESMLQRTCRMIDSIDLTTIQNNNNTKQQQYKTTTIQNNNNTKQQQYKTTTIQNNNNTKQQQYKKKRITITASGDQVDMIKSQLGAQVDICQEPSRRDTFPAILLASAYLCDVHGISPEEAVVVCPTDSYAEENYFRALTRLYEFAEDGRYKLVLMGIEPTEPSSKYGYIIPSAPDEISTVESFKEKPDRETAQKYLEKGALWNAGIFAYKLKYVLDIAEKMFGFSSYRELLEHYEELPKTSFDYAVVEKETKTGILRFCGKWQDLGTWNALCGAMSEETAGDVKSIDCINTHLINELQIPVIALGVKNLAIIATPDGILITDKEQSEKLKDYIT